MSKLQATATASGRLAEVAEPRPNGPTMRGTIKVTGGAEVEIAAFPKTAASGKPYFSLSVGDKDNRQYGVLQIAANKKTAKSPDYFGSINVEGRDGPTLAVSGWKWKGGTISLAIEPKRAMGTGEERGATESTFPMA